jgi:hypothetical protein
VNFSSSSRDVAAPSFLVSALATLALALMTALAFSTANTPTFRHVRATSADGATLLFLALCAALIGWTPLKKYFLDADRFDRSRHNAATFALAAAMFVIYSLARRSGPEEGWSLRFAFLPDDVFVVPFAARIVMAAALLVLILHWKVLSGWTRALVIGAGIIAAWALFSFRLLSGYFPVGVTETLDPTPLVTTLLQLVEYVALGILCSAATAHPAVRRWILRLLPLVLLALWARHHWALPVVEEEDE